MSPDQTTKTFVLKGVGVSPGIAIGKCYRYDPLDSQISFYKLKDESLIPEEISRFKNALKESEQQLLTIQKNLKKANVAEPVYVIDVHILILKDKIFINRTIKYIREMSVNAEWALRMTLDHYKEVFEGVEDDYISSRVSDVQYVVQRILRNLSGGKSEIVWETENRGVIIVSHDISPADTAQMKLDKILGFATDSGGRTSHTAIVARSLELPAVVGLDDITRFVHEDDDLIVDGTAGMVVINPYPDMLKRYEEKKRHYDAANDEYLKYGRQPAVTLDQHRVQIGCNIEFIEEIPSAVAHGAENIGLYRTEFLYIYRENLPTEEDHFTNYRQVVTNKNLAWSTIRTFDLGGDKFPNYQKQSKEMNPQMGMRAIRFCLKEVDIFKIQLRAIWRASALGNIKILFPMISSVDEIREAKKILEEARRELVDEGMKIPEKIDIGAMIEVPSAVVIADKIAREVDFFSIGTNDLIQYSLAIDRANERLTYMYEPLHPAVLRQIKKVVDAAHKAKIEVSMCGEMAGRTIYTPILLGMGIDQFSTNAFAISHVKEMARKIDLTHCQEVVKQLHQMKTADEIQGFMFEEFKRNADFEIELS